jgi:hypothetical protein
MQVLLHCKEVYTYIFALEVWVTSNSMREIHSTSGGTEESHAKSVGQPTLVSLPSFHYTLALPSYLAAVRIGTEPKVFVLTAVRTQFLHSNTVWGGYSWQLSTTLHGVTSQKTIYRRVMRKSRSLLFSLFCLRR